MSQTVCGKDGKSETIFLISDFANKNTLLIKSYLFIYFFLKGKDGKDGQNGETFNNFSPLFLS